MADQNLEDKGIKRKTQEINIELPDWLKYNSDAELAEEMRSSVRGQIANALNANLGSDAPTWLRFDPSEEAVSKIMGISSPDQRKDVVQTLAKKLQGPIPQKAPPGEGLQQ